MAYEQVRDVLKTVHAIHNGLLEQEESRVGKYALSLEELQGREIEALPTAD